MPEPTFLHHGIVRRHDVKMIGTTNAVPPLIAEYAVLEGRPVCGAVVLLRGDHDDGTPPHWHALCDRCEDVSSDQPVADHPALRVWAMEHRCPT
jgi:hypothetical protein